MSFSSTAAVFPQHAFLNPGPAPLPPGERPSESLPKSGSNASLSNHDNNSATSSSAYESASNSGGGSSNASGLKNRVLKQGWTSVKEDGSMRFMWTKKYLVLKDNSLEFQKSEVSIYKCSFSYAVKSESPDLLTISEFCFFSIRSFAFYLLGHQGQHKALLL